MGAGDIPIGNNSIDFAYLAIASLKIPQKWLASKAIAPIYKKFYKISARDAPRVTIAIL